DIRRSEELEANGKYKDSIHVPNELIQENQEEAAKLLPEDKNATLLIHCAVGGRASKAIDVAIDKLGYNNAYYLASPIIFDEEGNIKDYVQRALNPEQFEAKLKEEGVIVVDIRRDDELQERGKYKDSIHVPNELINEDLEAAAKLLPADKNATILIHCAKGGRASSAIEKVAYDLGYKNAYYLNSTIFFNAEGEITGYTGEEAQGATTGEDAGAGECGGN
ncbi:MAG: rhodanese-like domain-containing protein, partial [Tissierellales bacterium]